MKDVIDRHLGKTAFIVGNGPSARSSIESLIEKRRTRLEEEEIVFCCNDIDALLKNSGFSLQELRPDYWVLANPAMTVENSYNRINEMKSYGGCLLNGDSVLYSSSSDLIDISEDLLEVEFLGYDQRHFDGKACPVIAPCCIKNMNKIMTGRKTIQETLQDYTDHTSHYGGGSTVAVHMLAFSIIMGCRKIYLTGVDLDYSLGYFDKETSNHDRFDIWPDIPTDFLTIRDSANRIGVEIINLSQVSILRNIFRTEI